MNLRRNANGLLIVVSFAAIGYLLVALPGTIVSQYKAARDVGEYWAYFYLAAVGMGSLVLAVLAIAIVSTVWRNTRQKRQLRERRGRNPSQLSREEKESELAANLADTSQYAAGDEASPEVREEIAARVIAAEAKRDSERLEIVAFGTISSGKSSLLNALAGRDMFQTDIKGGTTLVRNEVPWPGRDRVILADTPGLAEIRGEARATLAAEAAKDADLVLFVVDGPLKNYETDLLRKLGEMEKRVLVCLNKEDWYEDSQLVELVSQIAEQATPIVRPEDIVTVKARPTSRRRVHVLADGSETEEDVEIPPDIGELADRMLDVIDRDGRDLLLANLLLQSRGLVEEAKEKVRKSLDRRADEIVSKYMWAAGGAAAVNPIPLLDLAGGSAIAVKMVLDLARVYRQPIDADAVVTLLGQLTKSLIAVVGATAAAPAVSMGVASILKTVPGAGTIAGGIVQGLTLALVTRWIGRVFIAYFRAEMTFPRGGLAELAREKWGEVTRPEQLKKLIQQGRERLREGK